MYNPKFVWVWITNVHVNVQVDTFYRQKSNDIINEFQALRQEYVVLCYTKKTKKRGRVEWIYMCASG